MIDADGGMFFVVQSGALAKNGGDVMHRDVDGLNTEGVGGSGNAAFFNL